MILETVGDRLKYFRQFHLNINQEELGKQIGMSREMISLIERGRSVPGFEFFQKLFIRYSELNQEWFKNGVGEMLNEMAETVLMAKEPPPMKYNLKKDENTVDLTDLFVGYYNEVELISQLLNNKQTSYRKIIQSLSKS